MYFKDCSPAAHMLHSRLQMVWSKLVIQPNMTAHDVVVNNEAIFQKAIASMKIPVNSTDKDEAAELLLFSLYQNQPVYYYEVMTQQIVNGYATAVSITSHDRGRTLSPADAQTRWTQEEAKEMYLLMKEFDARRDIWVRCGVSKY